MLVMPTEAQQHYLDHLHTVTDECKVWPFGKCSGGYGEVTFDGVTRRVHVLACEEWHGPRPQGQQATHGPCHNPLCWNGAHLSWATPGQNQRDRARDGTSNRGERCGNAKLTEAMVLDIRRRVAAGETQAALRVEYGLSSGALSRIVTRQRWAHL